MRERPIKETPLRFIGDARAVRKEPRGIETRPGSGLRRSCFTRGTGLSVRAAGNGGEMIF